MGVLFLPCAGMLNLIYQYIGTPSDKTAGVLPRKRVYRARHVRVCAHVNDRYIGTLSENTYEINRKFETPST